MASRRVRNVEVDHCAQQSGAGGGASPVSAGTVADMSRVPPSVSADDPMAGVVAELVDREPLFHRPETSGTSREDFEAVTAEDFWEVGASGRVYGREHVWSVLRERYAAGCDDAWELSDFACRPLSADTYLVTYLLRQEHRLTRRATIWTRGVRGWQIVYHQGTVVAQPT